MSVVFRLFDWIAQGRGSRRAISRSKRRKVMATRKNFMENHCLMATEFLFGVMKNVQKSIVVMVAQHCECN